MPSRRQLLAAAGTATGAALAGCSSADLPEFSPGDYADADWPMPRYDQQNVAYRPDAVAPRVGAEERWAVDHGFTSRPPAVVDGTVFLPTQSGLVALDAESGEEQWRFPEDDVSSFESPVVQDGVVYATDRRGVHALDADTGERHWSRTDVPVVGRPHLVGTDNHYGPVVYVGTKNGGIYRFHPATGEVTWQTDAFGTVTAFAFEREVAFVGTASGELYAFEEPILPDETPTEYWHRDLGSPVRTLVAGGGRVFVGADRGAEVVTDAPVGPTQWTLDGTSTFSTAPVCARGTLFTAGADGIAARNFDSGDRAWRVSADDVRRWPGPVAAGDTLYVPGNDGAVHAFDMAGGTGGLGVRFGAKRFTHGPTGSSISGMAVGAGALFVAYSSGSNDGTSLVRLDPAGEDDGQGA